MGLQACILAVLFINEVFGSSCTISNSYKGSGDSYSVSTSMTTDEDGVCKKYVTISGNGVNDCIEDNCFDNTKICIRNGRLKYGNENDSGLTILGNTYGELIIIQNGICNRKTYTTNEGQTTSVSTVMTDKECDEERRKITEKQDNHPVIWGDWSLDFKPLGSVISDWFW